MHALAESTDATIPRPHGRPGLDSYDSGEEFSFDHWIEVCKLVDDADVSLKDLTMSQAEEIERVLQEAVSEVEPAAAYQDFASHVV